MVKGEPGRPKRNSSQRSKNTNYCQVKDVHVTLSDFVCTGIGAITLGLGGILSSDAQFRVAGCLIFVGGILVVGFGIFFHARHRTLGNPKPALAIVAAFLWLISISLTAGISSWYLKATKDNDSFNVVAGTRLVTPSIADDKMSIFTAAWFASKEIVFRPINQLISLRITNKKNTPARITGVSLEVGSDLWWWPNWTLLCPVELRGAKLMIAPSGIDNAALVADDTVLENVLADKPIASADSAVGWMAWECPKSRKCDSKELRIGVADSAGVVSWQVISDPPIALNLFGSSLQIGPPIDLRGQSFKKQSACPSERK